MNSNLTKSSAFVAGFLIQILIFSGCLVSPTTSLSESTTMQEFTVSPDFATLTSETDTPSNPTIALTSEPIQVYTSTPNVTGTLEPEDLVQFAIKCWEPKSSIAITQTMGQLVLQPEAAGSAYLFDLATQISSELSFSSNVMPQEIVVSADWVVFEGASEQSTSIDSIIFQSADGEVRILPRELINAAVPSFWLNQEIFAFHRINLNGLDWLMLLNLSNNEISELRVDELPGIFIDDFVQQASWATLASFSPDLTRVVFMGDGQLFLWDLEKDRLILQITDFRATYDPPAWSPDGSQFVFIDQKRTEDQEIWSDKLTVVDRDGNIISNMKFGSGNEAAQILSYRWAPDSQKLAFWLNNSVVVANLETGEVSKYCIETHANLPHPPVWSSDSSLIAVGVVDENQFSSTLIVDIHRGFGSLLVENAIPVGWMRPSQQPVFSP